MKRQFPHGMKLANLNYIVMHCSSNENTIYAFIMAGRGRSDDPVSVIRRLSFRCMSRAAAERRLAVARQWRSQLVGDVLPQAEKVEPVGRLKQKADLVGDVLQQDQNK